MQLSSHQASASVVDHLTALMGVEEKVEGSQDLYIELILRNYHQHKYFPVLQQEKLLQQGIPKGAIDAGWDNEKHLDQSLREKDQQLLAKRG